MFSVKKDQLTISMVFVSPANKKVIALTWTEKN